MSELDSRLTHFIVVGNNYAWGKDRDEKKAIANMHKAGLHSRKATEFNVYRATEATYVNDMGGLNRPRADPEAVLIRKVGGK